MLTRLNVLKVVQHHSVSTLKFMHENVSKTFWAALHKLSYSTVTHINESVLDKSPFSELHCDVLVVGGGSGGCTIASKFVKKLGKNKVVIIEPRELHYYQPMFTLIGAGIKNISDSEYAMSDVLPSGATWLKDRADRFEPESNVVYTKNGSAIFYKYLVIACGLILHFDKIKGVPEALAMEDSGVCSNYTPEYAEKTFKILQNLKEGNAVFNFPTGPVKCAGAPLKACFLSEHYVRLNNRRNDINFIFNTSLPTVFAVKYYAEPLYKLFVKKNINVNFRRDLVLVKPDIKEATFRLLDKTFELEKVNYSMLHVTPPMSTPPELKSAKSLVDRSGYLNVEISTLQHVKYKNIFGLGDCTNLPTSKTAAAVASQAKVVYKNISNLMQGKEMLSFYNGYTSCPLITGFGTCVLAEFDYEHNPLETLPVDQRKERAVTYYLKRDIFPRLYWLCLKGFWNGPQTVRKILHLGGIIKQSKVIN